MVLVVVNGIPNGGGVGSVDDMIDDSLNGEAGALPKPDAPRGVRGLISAVVDVVVVVPVPPNGCCRGRELLPLVAPLLDKVRRRIGRGIVSCIAALVQSVCNTLDIDIRICRSTAITSHSANGSSKLLLLL